MKTTTPHPTWIEIDLGAVTSNSAHIIRDTGTPLLAIVKGDAYGHGAVQVSRAALAGGASWLGVARFGEARELRLNGIESPVLVLGMVSAEEVDEAIARNVTLTLYSAENLQMLASRARAANQGVRVHLKVDTGMGRLGVLAQDVADFARQAAGAGGLLIDGMYSHLAMAEEQDALNQLQQKRFQSALNALEQAGLRPRWVHLANSAGAFFLPQTRYDMVRVGNVTLGLRIRIDQALPVHYRPALTWKAQLASSRNLPAGWGVGYGQTYFPESAEITGVIPVGFGDGLRRVPGNQVLIGGQKAALVGRLCLDQSMVRLEKHYPLGEEVVIIGQQGSAAIWVHDLAALYQISQVDFTTLIHRRVPRIYV
jgi:alanine racemase